MRTMSDHILDILQNSVRAGATLIEVIVRENKTTDIYALEIKDNGHGMTREEVQRATQPFFTTRTTRRVGLGLPLLRQNAEMTGGSLTINSEPGIGTIVTAEFGLTHIDRPAAGDLPGVFVLTVIGHAEVDFIYRHVTEAGSFEISTIELKDIFEGIPLRNSEVRYAIRELMDNNLEEIGASK
jgi:hypothetical protein